MAKFRQDASHISASNHHTIFWVDILVTVSQGQKWIADVNTCGCWSPYTWRGTSLDFTHNLDLWCVKEPCQLWESWTLSCLKYLRCFSSWPHIHRKLCAHKKMLFSCIMGHVGPNVTRHYELEQHNLYYLNMGFFFFFLLGILQLWLWRRRCLAVSRSRQKTHN